ncbi:MAG: phosphotriesterase-related protein [Proteobacteria bacterium]|nr:phosphotriesterase-related protein [Pseudomonadota bacterium]
MAQINGVLGPIDLDDLGFTLMHEHILIANWSMRQSFADWVDIPGHIRKATEEVRSAGERGVNTIVDLTPINLGRDIHVIREVAERAEMQVIAATGLYWTEEPWIQGWEVETLVDTLITDIEKGIQGTSSKAGIIKCATDHLGVTPLNKKTLQVAARLHRATGVPISTHTSSAEHTGLRQIEVFEEEGVDLRRVVIGHCGDTEELEYLESILRTGCFIGMDRFGLDMMLSTAKRVSMVAELCRRGYADQMVLSHDACCHIDWFPKSALAAVPNWNFRHISDDVVPALRKEGVSEDQLHQLTVSNPRRVFAAQGSY